MQSQLFEESAVCSVVLPCRDLDASLHWYRDKLGWAAISRATEGSDVFATFSIGGLLVSLWELPDGEEAATDLAAPHIVIYVYQDFDRLRRRLAERGVELGDVIQAEHHAVFRFRDPDGNAFEVTTATGGEPPFVTLRG